MDETTSILIILLILITTGLYKKYSLFYFSIICITAIVLLNESILLLTILSLVILCINIKQIRRYLISYPILKTLKALNILPKISDTEKTAIEAGSVWMDAELFSGKPNIKKMISQKNIQLSKEEKSFLNNQTEKLCEMTNDWEVHKNREFSKEIWDYLKKEKFFGLCIEKKYGGLGFSARAHSEIIKKIASRSSPLSITVMVPNSLGPAELIAHYGTDKQKEKYLKNLANGNEIPCFALTETPAGSDAGAMQSEGIVFKDKDNKIKIKINFKKRYISLAAISTILGLAFKLRDPEKLISEKVDIGITCALIRSSTKGIIKEKRHDPLGVPFYNCPIEGQDIIISISDVIGEEKGLGKGWKMLMECLAAGRGISLPATCTAGIQQTARISSSYASIREQFGLNIGKFEGIQEPLAYIAGMSYIMESARQYTCIPLDNGEKPAIISAIMKYHTTEEYRKCINHGMDILGGAAISKGPKNLLAHGYLSSPISITVEGANILTRTLMIFGQGAIRCHPYIYKLITSLEENNIDKFDYYLFKHIGHILSNKTRYILLSLTKGKLAKKEFKGTLGRNIQKLKWASSMFAFFADCIMGLEGGNLKRKEKITGRFADILSWLYLATATMWYYQKSKNEEELEYLIWSMDKAFAEIQSAFEEIFLNRGILFKLPLILLRLFPIGTRTLDKTDFELARSIQNPTKLREKICQGTFVSKNQSDQLNKLESAIKKIKNMEEVINKIKKAKKSKQITRNKNSLEMALKSNLISLKEFKEMKKIEEMKKDLIEVDSFPLDTYLNHHK
ncbi:MAG: acyl-CoA dehydrogenase [bacterium]